MRHKLKALSPSYREISNSLNFHLNCFPCHTAHDWEVDSIAQLLDNLYEIKFRQGEEDRLTWIPSQ